MISKLGFIGSIYTFICFVLTKTLYPKQRLIRFPFEIRGKKNIQFGNNLTTGRYCRIETYTNDNKPVLFFGNDCQINDNVHIVAMEKVKVGNNVLIASRVFISDLNHGSYSANHHSLPNEIVSKRPLFSNPVAIEDNVWIGEGVIILPGVTIGENTIIGANSVITKNAEANSIYAGNPAVKIKEFDFIKKKWVSMK